MIKKPVSDIMCSLKTIVHSYSVLVEGTCHNNIRLILRLRKLVTYFLVEPARAYDKTITKTSRIRKPRLIKLIGK